MHGSILTSEDDDDRVLVQPPRLPSLRGHSRTESSSSSIIDFPDYAPTVSPSKSFASAKSPPTPSSVSTGGRAQVKNAFKNSLSGLTREERLQQMGVGSAGALVHDDFSDSEEQQYALTQQPYTRVGAARLW